MYVCIYICICKEREGCGILYLQCKLCKGKGLLENNAIVLQQFYNKDVNTLQK